MLKLTIFAFVAATRFEPVVAFSSLLFRLRIFVAFNCRSLGHHMKVLDFFVPLAVVLLLVKVDSDEIADSVEAAGDTVHGDVHLVGVVHQRELMRLL